MNSQKHLILGYGYSAAFLKDYILNVSPDDQVLTTSRSGDPHLCFNLQDKKTWGDLPSVDFTYWTFPPAPFDDVQKFFDQNKQHLGKLVVVGSTSGFENPKGETIDETSELDDSIERVRAEGYLRRNGAVLLLSSGIYGPGRSPLSWIERGLVGKSEKLVNMIHGADLAQFIFQAGQLGKRKALYIASDNNPQTWREVIENWESRGLVRGVPEKESSRVSKRIDNSASIKELKVSLKFRSFADSVS